MVYWCQHEFLVSFGKGGKFMSKHLPGELYSKILSTYSDHQADNNWKSLDVMTDLFAQLAKAVAGKLNFGYDLEEEQNAITYLKQCYAQYKVIHS
jgi:aminoglycoside 6-adenylyltransferase